VLTTSVVFTTIAGLRSSVLELPQIKCTALLAGPHLTILRTGAGNSLI